MNVLRTETGQDSLVTVSGNPSLRDAEALKEALIESLDAGPGTVVDVSSLDRADLAVLQVICSAARAFKDTGVRLSVRDSADPGPFRTALRMAGFPDIG